MSISAEIERFIIDELVADTGVTAIDPVQNLLFAGLVDSFGLMKLVAFLEERFELRVDHHDISPDDFESVATIEGFVERKRTGHDA